MQTISRRRLARGAAAGLAAAAIARPAASQAKWKWDLPAGYPATNFHSVNLIQFAKDVKDATAGKLEITVHAGASLFKVPEIMRAVQTNQAQMGELLMVVLENEDALFGADNVPFLATSFPQARRLAGEIVLLHRGRGRAPLPELTLIARGRTLEMRFPVRWLREHPLTVADLSQEIDLLRAADLRLRVYSSRGLPAV